ncbi:MAG TPA: lipase maturation factor family protein [Bryobacteraceae bacterium]|nr:lipase maturation factor family protein [Bryobacteraceae bacterium]
MSFGIQEQGLVGVHGILPFGEFLKAVKDALHAAAYWNVPTLLWLLPNETAMKALCLTGCLWAAIAVFGRWQRAAMAICLVVWLSLCGVGQDFYSFQWDYLLCEVGFLALFANAVRVRIWLFRWLLFRLMFFSGMVKLLSGDIAWRNLTALTYHYYTQPLPTPLAWYLSQLPAWCQKISTGFVFFAELVVPFLCFAPRRLRHIAAWLTLALQVLILLTGNYTFFNYLTIFLCMWLFIEPDEHARASRAVTLGLAILIGALSGLTCLQLFSLPLPPGGQTALRMADSFRIVNSYGLFAVMTTSRQEIIVEGSNDGENWQAYEFPYKPGDVYRHPPIVAPYQPRLDWQMWFAALGSYRDNRWFVDFVMRLLEGDPAVLNLLSYNPFPKSPPKYVRALTYIYTFTHFGNRAWWSREPAGTYLPAVSLR